MRVELRSRVLPTTLLGLALIAGAVVRFALRGYATQDTYTYLLPWYAFARDHGLASLGSAFTNYTPAYSYLLLAIARLDGLAADLTLVKSITWAVELANAWLAAQLVLAAGGTARRAALAAAAVWLAPTVLFNGAAWGQIDSLWAGFLMLSVLMCLKGRDGTAAFGGAFAMKAQAAFLGPFVLGQILRGRIPLYSLAWIPAIYLAAAVPVLVAGRPLGDVLAIYLDQAQSFHHLSMNAASIWAILGDYMPYAVGVPLGLAAAAAAGFVLARWIARMNCEAPETLILAATASALLMPLLLPKMHDRYFYAFELLSIVLAATNLRYAPLAVAAQATGLAPYLAIEQLDPVVVKIAAVGNALICLKLLKDLSAHVERPGAPAESIADGGLEASA